MPVKIRLLEVNVDLKSALHARVYIYIYIYIYVYVYVYEYVYMNIYIYICMYVCIYMYIFSSLLLCWPGHQSQHLREGMICVHGGVSMPST